MADSSTSSDSSGDVPKKKLTLRMGGSSKPAAGKPEGGQAEAAKPKISLTPKQREAQASSGYTEPPIEEPVPTPPAEKKSMKLSRSLEKGKPGLKKLDTPEEVPSLGEPAAEEDKDPPKPKLSFTPRKREEPKEEVAQTSSPKDAEPEPATEQEETPSKPKLSFTPRTREEPKEETPEASPEPSPEVAEQELPASSSFLFAPEADDPAAEEPPEEPTPEEDVPVMPASVPLKTKLNLKATPKPEEEPAPEDTSPPPPSPGEPPTSDEPEESGKKAKKTKAKKEKKQDKETDSSSGKKKKILPLLLVAVVASGGYYAYSFLMADSSVEEPPAVAAVTEPVTETAPPAPTYTVEQIEEGAPAGESSASGISNIASWLEETRFPLVRDSGDQPGLVYGSVFYEVGTIIDPDLGLKLRDIDSETRMLIFVDQAGEEFRKSY